MKPEELPDFWAKACCCVVAACLVMAAVMFTFTLAAQIFFALAGGF